VILRGYDAKSSPQFGPAQCKLCKTILRGIMFRCHKTGCVEATLLNSSDFICEECFRGQRHRGDHLVKYYKHCILPEAITPQVSRKLCHCTTVERTDSDGNSVSLFPVDSESKHRCSTGFQFSKCRLLQIGVTVAEAKLQSVLKSRGLKDKILKNSKPMAPNATRQLPNLDAKMEDNLDKDVPLAARNYASEKFPLGNTHISLMVGPLIIENGVPK
jgi:hypothetical protein